MTMLSRRSFLRADPGGRRAAPYPPWAVAEPRFLERCDGCRACVRACPEGILRAGWSGVPHVDFSRGECTFCAACVRACDRGALDGSMPRPWALRVCIGGQCLARQGVACGACVDACGPLALVLRPAPGGVAVPEVDVQACTGCGACVAPCPVGAVTMEVRMEAAA